MREMWFALLAALLLAGGVPAAAQTPAPKPDAAKAASLLAVTAQDRILGNPKAPITIIEYASLSCPHCAHFENEVLPAIQKKWIDTGKARLVMRDFPLNPPALDAEVLARCLPPSRYYPLVRTMFANQDEWVKDGWRDALQRLLKFDGINKAAFDKCFAKEKYKKLQDEVVGSRLVAAQQLGVDATPTFFINGKKFEGEPTVAGFDQALAVAAAKS
jgi:protein-disulfide isomerase